MDHFPFPPAPSNYEQHKTHICLDIFVKEMINNWHFIWEHAKAIPMQHTSLHSNTIVLLRTNKHQQHGVGVGVEGGVEENIRRKTVSLFSNLVYNEDMKADTNSLVCVEKSEPGW